jgi:hypothetical protein
VKRQQVNAREDGTMSLLTLDAFNMTVPGAQLTF